MDKRTWQTIQQEKRWTYTNQIIRRDDNGVRYVKGRTHKAPFATTEQSNHLTTYEIAIGTTQKYNDQSKNFENCTDVEKFIKYPGYRLLKDDPLVLIDWDGGDEQIILDFLKEHPTDAMVSVSGKGRHLPYYMAKEDYEKIKHVSCIRPSVEKGDLFTGDILIHSYWAVYSGQRYKSSSDTIGIVTFEDLKTLAPNTLVLEEITEHDIEINEETKAFITLSQAATVKNLTLEEIEQTLFDIPTEYSETVRKAYEQLKYKKPPGTVYEHWRDVGLSLAHTDLMFRYEGRHGEADKIVDIYDEWSSRDALKYGGYANTREEYNSYFKNTLKMVKDPENSKHAKKYGTIKDLSIKTRLIFPKMSPKVVADPEESGKTKKILAPDPKNVENFDYLLKREKMEIVKEHMLDLYCVKGPESAINRWFNDNKKYKHYRPENYSQLRDTDKLPSNMLRFFQFYYNRSVVENDIKKRIEYVASISDTFSLTKEIALSKEWDGVERESLLKDVFVIDESRTLGDEHVRILQEGHIKLLRSPVITSFYPDEDEISPPASIVWQGLQSIQKTRTVKYLTLEELRKDFVAKFSTTRFIKSPDDYELQDTMRSTLYIEIAESERVLKDTSKVKEISDAISLISRIKYDKKSGGMRKIALLIMTTNKTRLSVSAEGNRKIYRVPLVACKTEVLEQYSKDGTLQQLYAEWLYKAEKARKEETLHKMIYLTEEEMDWNEKLNRELSSSQSEEMVILEYIFGRPADTLFNPKHAQYYPDKETDDPDEKKKEKPSFFYVKREDLLLSTDRPEEINLKKLQDETQKLPAISHGVMLSIFRALGFKNTKMKALIDAMEEYSSIYTDTMEGSPKKNEKALYGPYVLRKGRICKKENVSNKRIIYKPTNYFLFPHACDDPSLNKSGFDMIRNDNQDMA